MPWRDGSIEYVVDGPEDARDLLLFHAGTPAAAVPHAGLARAAGAAGMRVAAYSRGGYGGSTRLPGRSVADEAAISTAIVERLGHERFFTIGWSGGGPVALACAALLPDRVRAAATLAGIAPRSESGSAWETFWNPEQRKEWEDLATREAAEVESEYAEAIPMFRRMTVKRLAGIGGPPDARGLANDIVAEVQPDLVRGMRRAVSHGYYGYLDDNLAQARDWGFRVADIRVPVVVRHGALDKLVPAVQGAWLAANIPNARGVFYQDAGHGSIVLPWPEVVAQLREAAC
jgi:pimeloyl-ACP methyl ester carboxylesterase